MQPYTKKAIKAGVFSAIGYGTFTAALTYYDNGNFEIWKLLFKIIFFGIFMGLYFNYSFRKQFEKNLNNN
ncbi:hypothetical protein WH52_12345 [Tenacibaculum holothuriorum]|uniref:Uncharacterized protein n=1 Tax=Tenacibaculum holothuriorum TaxID=1635173 RepID=A0A1Y2P9X6_9FLAO|nr:hypothetical protein [Tenacibaculum holothuriorum]OSY87246.1 hypothetical protein WH52_12345 [Tenacibaculum holothuriorum]